MGFPFTYQFLGSINSKWRLVGNAVCPSVSRALAKEVLLSLNKRPPEVLNINKIVNISEVSNLNNFKEKIFNKQPTRTKNSRFRRHPIKDGNLTVTLSNYDIEKNPKSSEGKWFTSIQYGTGKGFPIQKISDKYYKNLEELLNGYKGGEEFLKYINNGFSEKIASSSELQKLYEQQKSSKHYIEPTRLVDLIQKMINQLNIEKLEIEQKELKVFNYKVKVPLKQFFALYAINKISSTANNK